MWNDTYHLYPYQEKASEVMQKVNLLLAYDMGTGKTPTTLHALESLRGKDFNGPGTVVVPASLKWQWAREVAKFTYQEAVVIDGSAKQREAQYLTVRRTGVGYMILSYDTFVRDWAKHNHLARGFLVLDEATAIKNFKSKRSKSIKEARDLYPIRFALTGTPIENGKAEEIFSIMEFIDPEILGKYWSFERQYIKRNPMGWIEGYRNLKDFHRTIKPYVARATHKQPEVAKYLPKVLHRDPIMVPLAPATAKAYEWIADDLINDLDAIAAEVSSRTWTWDDDHDENHPDGKVMAKITALRMLLDLPSSVLESATRGAQYASSLVSHGIVTGHETAPKMAALHQYINDHLDADPDNKVVVFTSFVAAATSISRTHTNSALFHGGLTPRQREQQKARFASDPSCRVFVSTDAGGYGLDLPQANLLINYDLPWQAGLLKQRSARIRRASSDWDWVVVQDFLVEGTIEERMRDLLYYKIAVSDAIVDGEGIQANGTVTSDLDSLRGYLKGGTV